MTTEDKAKLKASLAKFAKTFNGLKSDPLNRGSGVAFKHYEALENLALACIPLVDLDDAAAESLQNLVAKEVREEIIGDVRAEKGLRE